MLRNNFLLIRFNGDFPDLKDIRVGSEQVRNREVETFF